MNSLSIFLLPVGLLAYKLLQVVYRLTFHPLASFPGPKIAAATKWYEFYFDVCKGEGGQYSWEVQKMHEKHGPIVRINPDELHIKDSSYFGTLYAPFPARRDKWAPAASMTGANKGSFGTVEHFAHRKRRAANSALFSTRAIADRQPQFHLRVRRLTDKLAEHCERGTVVKFHIEALAFTTDLMTNWILGKPLGCQDDPAVAAAWWDTIQCVPRITPFVKQFPWIVSIALQLPGSVIKAILPDIALLANLRKEMTKASSRHAEARDNGSSKPQIDEWGTRHFNIFETLDASDLPEPEKDVHRQAQEAFVLILGGTETTARTITGCLFQLVSNPEIFSRLREELITVMPEPDSEPSLQALETLPFFTAVLKENLRNMQLMTSRFPLQSHTDLQYNKWTIPKMWPVSMTTSEVLLDETVFNSPRAFKPERWLDTNGKLHEDLQQYFVAFGRGGRSCQGTGIAWAKMYICVAQIVRRFDFELFETTYERDFRVKRDCFLGQPTMKSQGIRFRVTRDHAAR